MKKSRKRLQHQDAQAKLNEIPVTSFNPPLFCTASILLPMAGSGFFESRDIARLRQLNKSTNANFGMSVVKEVFVNNSKQLSSIKRNLLARIKENLNELSNDVSTKQAMLFHMENIDTSHSHLTALARQNISSIYEENRRRTNFDLCFTICAIFLAIYGLLFAKSKIAFCLPVVVHLGLKTMFMIDLNYSSNDLAHLRKIQQDVNLYVYSQNRIARQEKILVELQKEEKVPKAVSALPTKSV